MKYALLVFDWDGTLYDSAAYIVECVQTAATTVGLAAPEASAIKKNIGLSSQLSFSYLFPQLGVAHMKKLLEAYQCEILSQHLPTLFEGSVETLDTLRAENYLLAIATGKGRAGLDRDLAALGLSDYFITTRCADETFSKPHPQMLNEILADVHLAPTQALMIGDTEYDIALAKNAGVDALAVTYGTHPSARLGGDHVIGEIADIRELPARLALLPA